MREGTATAKERVRGGRPGKKRPATAAGMGNKLGRMEETQGGELERTGAQRVGEKRETAVGEVAREGENRLKSVGRENGGGGWVKKRLPSRWGQVVGEPGLSGERSSPGGAPTAQSRGEQPEPAQEPR